MTREQEDALAAAELDHSRVRDEHRGEAEAHAYESGIEQARTGVQEVTLDPDNDTTELDGMKPLCRIRFYEDRGDRSVGLDGSAGWVLAEDQRGTLLEELLADRDALALALEAATRKERP